MTGLMLEDIRYQSDYEVLEESEGKAPRRVRCLLDEIGAPTSNNRLYDLQLMKETVFPRLEEKIRERTSYMMVDHPPDGYGRIRSVGAILDKFTVEEQGEGAAKVWGEFTIVPTAAGKDVQAVLAVGGRIGISKRGFGEVQQVEMDGRMVDKVVEYDFKGYDLVLDPAVAVAGTEKIIENRQEVDSMDVKTLKEKYPEVAEALVREGQEAAAAEYEKKIMARIAEMQKEIDEAREKASVSEEAERAAKFAEALVALVKEYGLVDTREPSEVEEQLRKEKAELEQKLESLQKELETAKAEQDKVKEEAERAKAKAYLQEKIEGKPYAEKVRKLLGESFTVEDVDREIERAEAYAASAGSAPTTTPEGKGVTEPPEGSDLDDDDAAWLLEQERLAQLI